MRPAVLIAAAGMSLALGAPLLAQDTPAAGPAAGPAEVRTEDLTFLSEEEQDLANLEQEMTAAFGMLGELFKVDPLTPEQQARLPLGQDMARRIMPDGAFAAAMNQSIAPMMGMVMGSVTDDPRLRLAELSGVAADELAGLEDAAAQEALDIFDPQYAARNQRTTKAVLTLMTRLLEAVEPSYRDAMAQALAVRFEESELRELLAFFATPVGGKFASQSFLLQYDVRMMGVVEAMGPAFARIMPDMMEEIAAIETEFTPARDFTELSSAERARAARLLGKSVNALDALVPEAAEPSAQGSEPVA